MTDAEREFQALVKRAATDLHLPRHTGWVVLEVGIIWPTKRHRDVTNCFKCLCDSLERAGLVENDRYILPWVRWIREAGDMTLEPFMREGGIALRLSPAPASITPSPEVPLS